MNDQAILDDKGREANRDLNFREWSKSKHAQYFTPLKLSNIIYAMVKELLPTPHETYIKQLRVLDPTCGTGRLLYPFKRFGAQVIGIELDKEVSEKAKMLLGREAVRNGSLLDYATLLQHQFDIVVTNPPYGIRWSQEETDFEFEGLSYAKNIESQNATIQISRKALPSYNGWIFAIIPTSSFSNVKDNALRQFMYKEFKIYLRVTLDNLFKEEYGIEVQTDLVVGKLKEWDDRHKSEETIIIQIDGNDPEFENKVLSVWKPIVDQKGFTRHDLSDTPPNIPYLNNLIEIPISSNVEITPKGERGTGTALAMIDFYDAMMKQYYNPIVGKPTGLKEAYLESPILCKRGIDPAIQLLSNIGFGVTATDKTRKKIEALKAKFQLLSIPLYPPKDHQRLAYFEEREYRARADVYDTQGESEYRQEHRDSNNGEPKILFKTGKKYLFKPSWIRQRELADFQVIGEGKSKKTVTTEIDRGFLSIEIDTEQGIKHFREPEIMEIATLLEAFNLPTVKDISEERPEQVKQWKDKLIKEYPNVFTNDFEYQAEDLARILTKTKSAYIGYDMGGGKTIVGFVFNSVRKMKRVLVVCQSSLVENWINEAQKFGFKAERLTTHKSIDRLRENIRSKIEHEGTIFYITSYEFLSLDTGRIYQSWDCIKYDKDGNIRHEILGNTARTCRECSTEFSSTQRECPKCKDKDQWTGEHCNKCGHAGYTYSAKSIMQYPAHKRLKKLFKAVIIDEAQQAKSKTSFRGQAVRAIHAKSRLLLTGTIMKGYITDTFFNMGYVTRHNNPLFPYRFDRRGSKLFAEEFSTFQYKTVEFEDTLHKGMRKELPEVSNLNRFWKILSSFTVRRLKDEMIALPPKYKRIMALPLDPIHAVEYEDAVVKAKEVIEREMRKPQAEINMGAISKVLWGMRFAATVPRISPMSNVKIRKLLEIVKEIQAKGEKILIYSGLRDMQYILHNTLEKNEVNHIFVPSTMRTKDRFKHVKQFQEDRSITAIVAGLNVLNRGFTINAANHVIFTDVEYSPESTDQAEDRAHRTGQTLPVTCYYLLIDWDDEKANIDFKMFNLITQKKKAISNAIDGKVRFQKTAQILRAGGDYLALAKAISGEIEDPIDFEVERETVAEGSPEQEIKDNLLRNEKWDEMYKILLEKQIKREYTKRNKIDENQMVLF